MSQINPLPEGAMNKALQGEEVPQGTTYKYDARQAQQVRNSLPNKPYKNRSAKYRALKNFVSNQNNNPYKGQDINTLYKLYGKSQNQENADLYKTVQALENTLYPYKGFPSSALGISYADRLTDQKDANAALTHFDALKVGDGDLKKGLDELKILYTEMPNMTHKKIKELIALDDFSGIVDTISSYLPPLAKGLVNMAKNTAIPFVMDKLKQWTNTEKREEKMTSDTISQPPLAELPRKDNRISVAPEPKYGYSYKNFDAVNTKYLAAVICPEKFAARGYIYGTPLKTGILFGKTVNTLTSDSNGNTAFIVNPYNACSTAPTTTASPSFYAYLNPSGYNPITGFSTFSTAGYLAGPLQGISSNLQQYRLIGTAVSIIPTMSSLNNQGSIFLGQFLDQAGASTPILVTLPNLVQSPFFSTGNSKFTYRTVILPDNDLDFTLATATYAQNNFIQGVLTGMAASTNVANLEISYVYEYQPQTSNQLLSNLDYPSPGPATVDCLVNMLYMLDEILLLDFAAAYKLAETLVNTSPDFHSVLCATENFILTQPKRQNVPMVIQSPSNGLMSVSDDLSDLE